MSEAVNLSTLPEVDGFDPAAAPADLDALSIPDEQAWLEARREFELY